MGGRTRALQAEERRAAVDLLRVRHGPRVSAIQRALQLDSRWAGVTRGTVREDLRVLAYRDFLDGTTKREEVRAHLDALLLHQLERGERMLDEATITKRLGRVTTIGVNADGTPKRAEAIHEVGPNWTAAAALQRNLVAILERRMKLYGLEIESISADIRTQNQVSPASLADMLKNVQRDVRAKARQEAEERERADAELVAETERRVEAQLRAEGRLLGPLQLIDGRGGKERD